ncbi:SGS-domain-containing protein [Mytilinidion resinicola]|uniref:SGS-domain-containing protein n=1 Tax=Mytilinidion resinicola TaxID=574789 RepID=A0A6A6Y3A7_9PEZI|nr:SGS-domain-containing protein [Mytilinidion resinicola]KAF2803119.1 SGS-domain-containing protein [Mytilinidion resinicola]
MDLAARGAAALQASNFEEAIKLYTSALAVNPNAVDYYIKRSTAYQRAKPPNYEAALADAEVAVVLAHKRAKRELIKDSQLRRAIALFFLERYADAEYVFALVKKLDEKEKTLAVWESKVKTKMATLPEGDERRTATVKDIPSAEVPSPAAQSSATNKATAAPAASPKPIQPTPADKIKHDWYQNAENVYFTLLAKGVPKDKANIEIEKDSLSISFPIQDSSSFDYTLDPFFGPVDPEKSTSNITAHKIEITLKKATPGKWSSLEGTSAPATTSAGEKSEIPTRILKQENVPSYPTSSKSGPKNWDKWAKDLTTKKVKKEGEEDVGLQDDDLDADEGDETTRFFRTLFKGADPDAQRAMMKSYSESGGTVLSTDWSSVGKETVVPQPPDGMEAKKM